MVLLFEACLATQYEHTVQKYEVEVMEAGQAQP